MRLSSRRGSRLGSVLGGLGSAALLLASCALAALLAEVAVRFFPPYLGAMRALVREDAVTGYALRPGTKLEFGGAYSSLPAPVRWQVNAQGLRAGRFVPPPSERFRVATYGDSETFGWSVGLAETYQRQMEAIDPAVEVLNLGVPGFNVTNVADHLERTLARFSPDLAVYLVHKNDFDDPLRVPRLATGSHLLLRLELLHHFTLAKAERVARRHSPERAAVFARQVDRMARLCAGEGVGLLLAFLRWRNHEALGPVGSQLPALDLEPVADAHPKLDAHLTAPAYRAMAALVCEAISGVPERCVPRGWSRAPATRVATASR